MDLSEQFAKPKRGAGRTRTRLTLRVGGTPADAAAALTKFVKASKRLKVGKKLGASAVIKAERR